MSFGSEIFTHVMFNDSAFRALELAALREVCSRNLQMARMSLKDDERERETILPHWVNPNASPPTPEPE